VHSIIVTEAAEAGPPAPAVAPARKARGRIRLRTLGRMRGPLALILALAALPALLAGPASACLVCIAMPQQTVADRLLEAEVVAFARADPSRPYRYLPVEFVRGGTLAAGLPPVPFLVDSGTRRRLAARPEDAVILAGRTDAGWRLLGTAGPETRAAVRGIVAAAPDWARDAGGSARFDFFAARHASAEPALRQLALAEIARAPYGAVRRIVTAIPVAEIADVLADPVWAEWAPVHILLLGRSRDPAAAVLVARELEAAAAAGTATWLGSWATAHVEQGGAPALARLVALYLDRPGRSAEEMRAFSAALATLASGDPALRPGIAAAFRRLASAEPALAADAARQLLLLEDWSQLELFAGLLASRTVREPAGELVISLYVGAAREALARPQTGN
jgi:hypothetical protein